MCFVNRFCGKVGRGRLTGVPVAEGMDTGEPRTGASAVPRNAGICKVHAFA
ncbi:hypothetical protein [Kamptonema formosum]|uniref:hypothetical protein n=1 Tax=Kamptonema formosum TaxID=331992 RepID=UPI000349E19D|nr:hypothetical protein [Oscillatoria sp. PCC 10802]